MVGIIINRIVEQPKSAPASLPIKKESEAANNN
jgi:hypothetical protein